MDRITTNVHERQIKRLLKQTKGKNTEVLFHHRFATSTIDCRSACHPFSTKAYFGKNQYIGVHNGMIDNDIELRQEHEKLGISYVSTQPDGTFNDSEALIYDLARFVEGQVDKVTAQGSNAFIMVKRRNGKAVSVLFGRNYGNPLKIKLTGNSLSLSSEGEGFLIDVNTLYEFNYKTCKMTKTIANFPAYTFVSRVPASNSYTNGYWAQGKWHDFDDILGTPDTKDYSKDNVKWNKKNEFLIASAYDFGRASHLAEIEYDKSLQDFVAIEDEMEANETSDDSQMNELVQQWINAEAKVTMLNDIVDELWEVHTRTVKFKAEQAKKDEDNNKFGNVDKILAEKPLDQIKMIGA